jgi:hypothetical protein
VDFTVLFVSSGGAVDKAEESVVFTGKITSNSITAGNKPVFRAETQEISVVNLSSGEIRLTATVAVDVVTTTNKSAKCVSVAQGAYPRNGVAEFTSLVYSDSKKIT